jgi:hypothetical protein
MLRTYRHPWVAVENLGLVVVAVQVNFLAHVAFSKQIRLGPPFLDPGPRDP